DVRLRAEVRAGQPLFRSRFLRREAQSAAVEVRAELEPVFVEAPALRERERLKAARVRGDGVWPTRERVQASLLGDELRPGAHPEVIRVHDHEARSGARHVL